MVVKFFLLFTVVPCLELALLIRLGSSIGTLETVLLIIITGIAGALAVRASGLACLQRIRAGLSQGSPPTDELLQGLLILLAGALLITPGLLTDAAGFLLLAPPVRALITKRLKHMLQTKILKNSCCSGYTIYNGGD
ncbi:MAG: FxsA family protein [Deltaproteobacteria bacterium]|nr:FxsA family protein [Deltaproteobacteria bacterium]